MTHSTEALNLKQVNFGREVLGPIFYDYCHRLHSHMLSYDERNASFLFCARAGLRLSYLYELFAKAQGVQPPKNASHIFWLSRFMVAKGLFLRCPESAMNLIAKEFGHTATQFMLPCLLPNYVTGKSDIDISLEFDFLVLNSSVTPSVVMQVFDSKGEYGQVLRSHYTQQANLFETQINNLMRDSQLGVLIDSGWNATTQRLLMEGYPEIDWHGLYFGRFGDPKVNNWHFSNAVGLMLESYNYIPEKLENCIHYHHHIIEDLLEPDSPSVEYLRLQNDDVLPDRTYDRFDYKIPGNAQNHYRGVIEYFESSVSRASSLYQIRASSHEAWKILHEKVCFPSREDVNIVDVRERSADFGKKEKNPILIRAAREISERDKDVRLERAVWKQGQIALDFPDREARKRQADMISVYEKPREAPNQQSRTSEMPFVAVITRTKNRPVMLKRAALSVANQTFQDIVWVVVNDGGDAEEVNRIVSQSSVDLRKVVVIHNADSLGMEAASNKGIRSSRSKYVVIHDDDDTWQPQFLEKTVAFLEAPPVPSMRGVIAHANRLSEYIVDDSYVEIIKSQPYQDWVMTVPLYEMASMNMFAPISFLFSRDVYDSISGFDETLPVLGDWDFNLKFLTECDIGVIPEKLANYHHRDFQKSGSYSNSVYGAISKHQMFEAIVRNKGIRGSGKNQELTATSLLGIGRATYDLRKMLQQTIDGLRK